MISLLLATTAYHAPLVARSRSSAIGMNIRWGGKGFGGGEATRDPDPTYIDPNDPKGRQQAIHKAETFAEYMAARSAGSSDDVDPVANQPCYMLPYDDFPGQPSWIVGGEMEITELEDDSESRTQLFLNPDNTVTGGATDGPPPEGLCGLWQCGSNSFQMVLQRTFMRDPSTMPITTGARPMGGQLTYTVTRVYIGTVDESKNGPEAVTGKMIFMPQDEYTPIADPNSVLWEDPTYGLSACVARRSSAERRRIDGLFFAARLLLTFFFACASLRVRASPLSAHSGDADWLLLDRWQHRRGDGKGGAAAGSVVGSDFGSAKNQAPIGSVDRRCRPLTMARLVASRSFVACAFLLQQPLLSYAYYASSAHAPLRRLPPITSMSPDPQQSAAEVTPAAQQPPADDVAHASPTKPPPSLLLTLWRFSRPHTMIGSALAIPALALFAAPAGTAALSTPLLLAVLYALPPALLMNVYIVGLNQLFDIELDRVNKPNLPLAARTLSVGAGIAIVVAALIASLALGWASPMLSTPALKATLVGSAILGTAYSLPPLRLKRFPLCARRPRLSFFSLSSLALAFPPTGAHIHTIAACVSLPTHPQPRVALHHGRARRAR